MATCCYKGRGDLLIRKRANCLANPVELPQPFRFFGNVSSYEWTAQTEESTSTDYTLDRGDGCSLSEIIGMDVSLEVQCFSPANIALGLQSTGDDGNVAAVTADEQVVPATMAAIGSYIPLERVGSTAISVTNTAGSTIYVAGADYVVRGKNAIFIPPGSTIAPGVSFKIIASAPVQTRIELLNAVSQEYEILMNGLNIAQPSGGEIVARLYRTRFSADSINWITQTGLGNFTLTGKALKDDCAPTTEFVPGLAPSKYGYVQSVA